MNGKVKFELPTAEALQFLALMEAVRQNASKAFSEDPIRVSFVINLNKLFSDQFLEQVNKQDLQEAIKANNQRFY